jgi:ribosomal protein S12 methylthiotransferase accessory factor
VTHPKLGIPAFYTIIPGAHFRERAAGTSVGMFSAKLIAESGDAIWAINELKAMDKLLPEKYYIKFFSGVSHLSINEPLMALGYLEEALNLDPTEQDIPSIYSYMGVSLKELGRYDEAIETLKKAEEYDNERTDIYNLMGFCYFRLKDHEKAIESFRKVLQLNPGSAIDYANIASNYRDMGDTNKAIRYYKFALELDPTIDFAKENLRKLEQQA